jgi:hypothetical protein
MCLPPFSLPWPVSAAMPQARPLALARLRVVAREGTRVCGAAASWSESGIQPCVSGPSDRPRLRHIWALSSVWPKAERQGGGREEAPSEAHPARRLTPTADHPPSHPKPSQTIPIPPPRTLPLLVSRHPVPVLGLSTATFHHTTTFPPSPSTTTSPPTRPHLRGLHGRHGWSGSGTRLGRRGHDWTPEGQGVQPRNNTHPCSLGYLSDPDQAPHTTAPPPTPRRAGPRLRFPRTSQGRKQGHQTDL